MTSLFKTKSQHKGQTWYTTLQLKLDICFLKISAAWNFTAQTPCVPLDVHTTTKAEQGRSACFFLCTVSRTKLNECVRLDVHTERMFAFIRVHAYAFIACVHSFKGFHYKIKKSSIWSILKPFLFVNFLTE